MITPFHYKIADYRDMRAEPAADMPYRINQNHLINSFAATLNRDLFHQEPATLDVALLGFKTSLDTAGGGKKGELFIELELRAHDSQGRLLADGKFGCTAGGGEPFELGAMVNEMLSTGTFTNREPLGKLWENLFAECMERIAGDFGASVLSGDGVIRQ